MLALALSARGADTSSLPARATFAISAQVADAPTATVPTPQQAWEAHYDLDSGYATAPAEEWALTCDGPGGGRDGAVAIAVDPATETVFVAGGSTGDGSGLDYLVLACDPDGNVLWEQRYDGPGHADDRLRGMVLDPAAGRLYVTGSSPGVNRTADFATLALTFDGAVVWTRRFDGPANRHDAANAMAIDPLTGCLFVSGESTGNGTGGDATTVAYDPDGELLWTARYDGPAGAFDGAFDIAIDPDGARLFVACRSNVTFFDVDFVLLAYDTAGSELWTAAYDGPGHGDEWIPSVAFNPLSERVYLAGDSMGLGTLSDVAVVAYDTGGTHLWTRRCDGVAGRGDWVAASAVDAVSGRLFVSGSSTLADGGSETLTVACGPAGDLLWQAQCRSLDGADTGAAAVVHGAADDGIYVAGGISSAGGACDMLTVAYAADGSQRWLARYDGSAHGYDRAACLATGPDNGDLYVAGESGGDLCILKYSQSADPDGDGLPNGEEFEHRTDPDNPDTDGDGMPDGWEVQFGLDPLVDDGGDDPDGDGWDNRTEFLRGSNPTVGFMPDSGSDVSLTVHTPLE